MSCEDCTKIQNLAFDKNVPDSPPITYIRIGRANVAIVGCERHLRELINKLREDTKEDLCECGHKKKDHTSSYWEANGTACTQANCWNKCKKFIQKDLCEEGGEDGNKN